ncbi:PAS domain-containing protein [Streptomyces sp. DSM 44938]|uniref:PAS domain-containing protein n=1 Tax=Streptomyces litchfieldiae TaxID=3075543 RepID=A0ABU2MWU4_9ACTN|nr:PAS domain-containing protein [Streptomyces sp. DSM 44938]
MAADPERPPGWARIPLAVIVVDVAGRVSHWSDGARRLFGVGPKDAVGRPAAELLPLSTVLDPDAGDPVGEPAPPDPLPRARSIPRTESILPAELLLGAGTTSGTGPARPAAGRFWTRRPDRDGTAGDVLWWVYPLRGPGAARVLVLAGDGAGLRADGLGAPDRSVSPGFATRTGSAEAAELARRLPDALPGMTRAESGYIAGQLCDLGHPVLEVGAPAAGETHPGPPSPGAEPGPDPDRVELPSNWLVIGRDG